MTHDAKPLARVAAVLVAALAFAGCDSVRELRAVFHPEETASPGTGHAGVEVEVVPSSGIAVLIDGAHVASRSPFVTRNLAPGEHVLEVHARGYHPLRLVVTLADYEILEVPVALRLDSSVERRGQNAPPAQRHEIPAAPPPPAPLLPPGVPAAVLHVASAPPAPGFLDGIEVQDATLVLDRVTGTLRVGTVEIGYALGPAELLELVLPEDDAIWRKDGALVPPGSRFKLHHGPVQLRRTAEDGSEQTVLLSR